MALPVMPFPRPIRFEPGHESRGPMLFRLPSIPVRTGPLLYLGVATFCYRHYLASYVEASFRAFLPERTVVFPDGRREDRPRPSIQAYHLAGEERIKLDGRLTTGRRRRRPGAVKCSSPIAARCLRKRLSSRWPTTRTRSTSAWPPSRRTVQGWSTLTPRSVQQLTSSASTSTSRPHDRLQLLNPLGVLSTVPVQRGGPDTTADA